MAPILCVSCLHRSAVFLLLLLFFSPRPAHPRHLSSLVPSSPPLILTYHNGPLLSGSPPPLSIYLLWYGSFSAPQRAVVTDFLASFHPSATPRHAASSVASWWSITAAYTDKYNASVSRSLKLGGEALDMDYSLGKSLTRSDVESLLTTALHAKSLTYSHHALYLVLTAADVYVDRFCMDSCGYHDYTFPSSASHYMMLPYVWVGNSATQCPGQCAWPFAVPEFGPPYPPLLPPNGDVGMDGMIINIATLMAGAATNPYETGFFYGDSSDPLEAAGACVGSFGPGSFPGYPGQLLLDKKTGASYNANGAQSRKFLLPAIWNPDTLSCTTPS